jgi:single-strand DNA-binding protein
MANLSIHGNIGRAPELRQAGASQVLSFSVADKGFVYSKTGDAPPQWYDVEVWGREAERLSTVLAKGSSVVVYGQLIQRPYAKKDGTPGLALDVKAHAIEFAGRKADAAATAAATASFGEVPF